MSSAKEIRGKIGSIRNTQKITKAMEMVAASKMRKTQQRMRAARPYAEKIRNVISHLAHVRTEYVNPLLREAVDDPKRIGLIIVSSDRGLCGGLNANLFRETMRRMRQWENEGKSVGLSVIGKKAAGFFSLVGARVMSRTIQLGDRPGAEQIVGSSRLMVDAYAENDLDMLYIVYNRFINAMTQSPCFEQLLPLASTEEDLPEHWDYLYEPDPVSVLETLIRRYMESLIYQAVVENIACEQAARMVAMKSASDNAGKLIDELQLIYNKARQAQITQELSEIVGGAAAISE